MRSRARPTRTWCASSWAPVDGACRHWALRVAHVAAGSPDVARRVRGPPKPPISGSQSAAADITQPDDSAVQPKCSRCAASFQSNISCGRRSPDVRRESCAPEGDWLINDATHRDVELHRQRARRRAQSATLDVAGFVERAPGGWHDPSRRPDGTRLSGPAAPAPCRRRTRPNSKATRTGALSDSVGEKARQPCGEDAGSRRGELRPGTRPTGCLRRHARCTSDSTSDGQYRARSGLSTLRVPDPAPTGGNSQRWRWVVVDDPEVRASLAALYRKRAEPYMNAPGVQPSRVLDSSLYLTQHMHEVPVLVIRASSTGNRQARPRGDRGSSARSCRPCGVPTRAAHPLGLGSVFTTLPPFTARCERTARRSDTVTQAALIPVAYTTGGDFKPAVRRRSRRSRTSTGGRRSDARACAVGTLA